MTRAILELPSSWRSHHHTSSAIPSVSRRPRPRPDSRPTFIRHDTTVNATAKDLLVDEPLIVLPHDLGTEEHPIFDQLGIRRGKVGEEECGRQVDEGSEERMERCEDMGEQRCGRWQGAEWSARQHVR